MGGIFTLLRAIFDPTNFENPNFDLKF